MAGVQKAPGAPSASDDWNAIDWPSIQREVERLQMRIAKAEMEKRAGKVNALQRILAHSYSAKLWAVRRVVMNKGRRTPGVDGVVWQTPEERLLAARSLSAREYHPQPLRRIYIPKKNGKLRPLSIPTMKDRAMQALYLLGLDPVAEVRADPNSYGFRRYRSAADALGQCFLVFAKKRSPTAVYDADITSCYDRISQPWLIANVPMDKTILRKWLTAGFVEDTVLYPTREGTPQGGIISPVLANLTLDGLERVARDSVPSRSLVNVVRYADDFLVTARTPEMLHEKIIPAIDAFLAERDLEISAEKSRVTDIEVGFDFLGATIRKYGDKLLITPSRESKKTFLGSIRETIKAHTGHSLRKLLRLINPRIRGWANYYRTLASSRVFREVDRAIYGSMVRWMRRRHPGKGRFWLRNRYFRRSETGTWILTASPGRTAASVTHPDLFQASRLPIRRHVKIAAAATAYDPEFQDYFRERRKARKAGTDTVQAVTRRSSSPNPRQRRTQPGHVTVAYGKA